MAFVVQNDPVPLQVEENSGLRIGKSHIFLDTVVAAHKQGATAEEIVWQFPVLPLADVYAVLSYYLRHTAEIEAYLTQQSFAALEPAEPTTNGHSQKSNHPMMALASLGECADPTVAARAKEILAQEIDHTVAITALVQRQEVSQNGCTAKHQSLSMAKSYANLSCGSTGSRRIYS